MAKPKLPRNAQIIFNSASEEPKILFTELNNWYILMRVLTVLYILVQLVLKGGGFYV